MRLAGVLDSERERCPVDRPWWAPALQAAGERDSPLLRVAAWYRFGDAVLHVAADDPALLAPFGQLYGECAVPAPAAPEPPRVRCVVRGAVHAPLLLVTFLEGAPPDLATAALGLLHPPRGEPPYAVRDAPLKGWRLVGGVTQPVVAACDTCVLVDPQQVPEDFLAEYLVSATLAAQPELLVVHAAALRLGSAGVLLAGPSRAGKTTTAAHLAARGHTLLGDELAVLRLPTHEIVPLRRSVSLRSGPRAPELSAALARLAVGEESRVNGGKTGPLRIDKLFPGSPARPASLRAAFLLGGFADHPSLAECRLTLNDVDVFDDLAANDVVSVSWGLAPAPRVLRLLALNRMLARIPCWRLKVGPPIQTAELIERTVEES